MNRIFQVHAWFTVHAVYNTRPINVNLSMRFTSLTWLILVVYTEVLKTTDINTC